MTNDPFNPGFYNSEELRRIGFKSVGENVSIAKNCTIIGFENITIGDNVRIDGNVIITSRAGFLSLGSYIHISGGCHLICGGGVTLKDFTALSHGGKIYSVSDDYSGGSLTNATIPAKYLNVDVEPVVLEKHALVGSGCVVLPGVVIGEGSSVGALSLVNKSLEEWGVYAGTPARRLKARKKKLLDMENDLRSSID